MSLFESLTTSGSTAEQGALRLRRTLATTFEQIESSLDTVRHIVERHGRSDINSALGSDQRKVETLYAALKKFVEQHKPDASIPDLPK